MGDVSNKLRENARFLERKGWSKSAVLENAGAAELDRLAADNERLQRELAEARENDRELRRAYARGNAHSKPCCGEFATCDTPCVPLAEHLRQQLQAAREAIKPVIEAAWSASRIPDPTRVFRLGKALADYEALAPPADAKGEAE